MFLEKRLPSWIRDIDDNTKRTKVINDLGIEDVFRSQFRSEANSPRSNIEVINWGLEHIDRLRKAELEAKMEKTRVFSSVWLPLLSTLVAVIAVLSSFYVQFTNNKNQIFLKHYEVELRPKQIGYSEFMKAMTQTCYSAQHNDKFQMVQDLDKIENSYYSIEPFLNDKNRIEIWNQYQKYSDYCYNVLNQDSLKGSDKTIDSFILFRNYFRTNLYSALFLSEQKK